jgi:hypothetical protein
MCKRATYLQRSKNNKTNGRLQSGRRNPGIVFSTNLPIRNSQQIADFNAVDRAAGLENCRCSPL